MAEQTIEYREEVYWQKKKEFIWLTPSSIKNILSLVPTPQGCVLEICSGSGMFTSSMDLSHIHKYYCLDISSSLLQKLKKELPSVIIQKGDAQNLPFKDNSFDMVAVFAGLHHLSQLELSVLHSYRVLKNKGTYVCFEPNNDAWYRFLMLRLRNVLGIYTEDETFLKPQKIIALLQKMGFRDINISYITPTYSFANRWHLFPLFCAMKLFSFIPGRYMQSFFIIVAKKS